MQIEVVKSKIHRVKVTVADLNYIEIITIDGALAQGSNHIKGEKASVRNVNNGRRFDNFTSKGNKNPGKISISTFAVIKRNKAAIIITLSCVSMDFEDAKNFKYWTIFPNKNTNFLTRI